MRADAESRNKYRICSFPQKHPFVCLTVMMLITGLYVYRGPLSGRSVYAFYGSGSDAVQQYVPTLISVVYKLRNLDFSFWESNMGFGTDMLMNPSHIMDPFNIPFYVCGLLGLERAMFWSLALMQLLKCCMTGWLAMLFLRCFSFRNGPVIAASYCCSFCGFIMLWGMHYFFATGCVFLLLIFWLLERSLQNARFMPFLTLAVAAALIFSLYVAYMIALGCALYLLVRLADGYRQNGFRQTVRLFAGTAGCVLLAALLSAVVILPVYYQMTEVSGRLAGTATLLQRLRAEGFLYTKEQNISILLRMLSNNFQGTEYRYQGPVSYIENIQLFFSLLLLPSLVLFFSEGIGYGARRKGYAAGLALTAAFLFLPLTAYIFNRGVNRATRYSFVLLPFAAWVIAFVLHHIRDFHRGSLLLTWILMTVCCGYLYRHRAVLDEHHLYRHFVLTMAGSLLFLLAVTIASSVRSSDDGKKERAVRECAVLLSAVLAVVNVTVDANITVNAMEHAGMEEMLTLKGRWRWTQPGLQYVKQMDPDGTDRVEKTFYDQVIWCESQEEDYSGVSYYNTTCNRHVVRFIHQVWPEIMYLPSLGHNYVVFRNDYRNARMAALLNIRYILSTVGPALGTDAYELVSDTGVYVYENRLAKGLGILYDRYAAEEDLKDLTPQERQAFLADMPVLSEIPSGYEAMYAGQEALSSRMNGDMAPSSAGNEEQLSDIAGHGVSFRKEGNDGHLAGETDSDGEGLLFVSVPWDRGWTAYVNGVKTEIQRADYGFQAVFVPEGHSEIRLVYRSPLLREGFILTGAGWLLFFGWMYIRRRKARA